MMCMYLLFILFFLIHPMKLCLVRKGAMAMLEDVDMPNGCV